jgi:hypothetical protein
MRDRISIEEWEYACGKAMERETFHKVPLPAMLFDYVQECRAAQQRALAQDAARQREVAAAQARTKRLALEASPEWQAEQARRQAQQEEEDKAYEAWKATQPMEVLVQRGIINPPDARRWLPLTDDLYTSAPRRSSGRRKERDADPE